MQGKQRLLVGALNASFACSSFSSLEVCFHRKILKIRCREVKSDIINYMPLNLLFSHNFIILLGNMVSYLATLLKRIGSSYLRW